MLEFYQAYATYEDLMDLTEEMISQAAMAVTGSTAVKYGEHEHRLQEGLAPHPDGRVDPASA